MDNSDKDIIKEQEKKIFSLTSSANAWKMIDDFIKSKNNPTLKIYKEVAQECFNDGCHSAAIIHMRYIERLSEMVEDF